MQTVSAPESSVSAIITEFLIEHCSVFKELLDLRTKGWEATEGDQYFRDRRDKVDNVDYEQARKLFDMTCQIGEELDKATSVIALAASNENGAPKVLDMGMAPGGFTSAVLKRHPATTVRGITLPKNIGGLEIMLPRWNQNENIQIEFIDITMLADDMGSPSTAIPLSHPDSANFSSDRPFLDEEFDLIFCGAAVQRKHPRAAYRESRERLRLTASQLIMALRRVREGGSLVVLLHKPEAWNTASLIRTFTRFSNVRLFKPKKKHAIRSSFYMVATKVRPQDEAAQSAIREWMSQWQAATFGTDDDLSAILLVSEDYVRDMLANFGPELIALATPVWKAQAASLKAAPFLKNTTNTRKQRTKVQTTHAPGIRI